MLEEGSAPPFQVGVSSEEIGRIIWLKGELDLGTVAHLDEAIALALREDPPVVVVDLSSLDFMDSTGIRSLLQLRERCHADGRRLLLVPGGHPIQRVLEISGVADRFEYVTGEDAPRLPAGNGNRNGES